MGIRRTVASTQILVTALSWATPISAEPPGSEDERPPFAFTFDVDPASPALGLITGTPVLGHVTFPLSDHWAIHPGLRGNPIPDFVAYGGEVMFSLGFDALDGPYLGLLTGYVVARSDFQADGFILGTELGYRHVFSFGLLLGLYVGIEAALSNDTSDPLLLPYPFLPRGGIKIGWGFRKKGGTD